MDRLFIFATYWNEIEWIHTSLKQIESMNPYKVFICDGCYDDTKEVHSDDGTYEVIKEFISLHDNAVIVDPVRCSKFNHFKEWIREIKPDDVRNVIGRAYALYLIYRCNKYRLNQAATFNKMLSMAGICKGDWFTTYDCDQFYSEKLISAVNHLEELKDYDMIVGHEMTFFGDFNHATSKYEVRDYNNMPHRYYNDVRFLPTRLPMRVSGLRYKVYSDVCKKKYDSGNIYHYRIKSLDRIRQGYSLGDRKPPEDSRTKCVQFGGSHPKIIVDNVIGDSELFEGQKSR